MNASISAIEYYLPDQVLSNEALADVFDAWSAAKIEDKIGVRERRIAAADEFVTDMAVQASRRLFASGACSAGDIDFVLLCTQSPDYLLPTSACLVQDRLGIATTAGALDFNLGCSGFVYGLGLAKGLIATGQAERVLLLTSETYSKHVNPLDRSVRTLFGDAAAATLVSADADEAGIGALVYGTDGSGAENLIVPAGGMRRRFEPEAETTTDSAGNVRSVNDLYMHGAEIFNFSLRVVPRSVAAVLDRAQLSLDDIDHFVFHQANAYMLEHLRRKLHIPADKFVISMRHCGNTVSSTIPIALRDAMGAARFRPGDKVLLAGFGVGYSWAAAVVTWGAAAPSGMPSA